MRGAASVRESQVLEGNVRIIFQCGEGAGSNFLQKK